MSRRSFAKCSVAAFPAPAKRTRKRRGGEEEEETRKGTREKTRLCFSHAGQQGCLE